MNSDQNDAMIRICKIENRKKTQSNILALFLIHGGPGTGKSFLANKLKERYSSAGLKMVCGAPTGVAASCIQVFFSFFIINYSSSFI